MYYYVKQRNSNSFNYNNSESICGKHYKRVMEYQKILVITQGLRQGCPLSRVLFNLYLDEVIRVRLKKVKSSKYFKEVNF